MPEITNDEKEIIEQKLEYLTGFIGQIRQEQEKWEELDLDYQLQKKYWIKIKEV